MKKANGNVSFNIPTEYCGQGVGVSSQVSIATGGSAYICSTITDGNDKNIGTFELSDDREKAYLNLRDVKDMKRRTLVNILGKLKETVEFALADQLEAEDDGQSSDEEAPIDEESPTDEEAPAGE